MDLPAVTPETVAPSVTCRKVIKIKKQLAVDQVPIVQLDGNVVGVATLGNIMAKIIAGVIDDTTPVSEVIYRQFMKVSPNVTLGKLSKILEHHWFAIVVNSQKFWSGESSCKSKEMIVSLVTRIDLLNFITDNEPKK